MATESYAHLAYYERLVLQIKARVTNYRPYGKWRSRNS